MAITFVNETDNWNFSITSLAATVPASVADHDVLILHAQNSASHAFDALAGWTSLGTNTQSTEVSQLWWRLAASEPASYSLTWGGGSSGLTSATMIAYRGADITTPIHTSAIAGGTTQTFAAPTVTTALQCTIVVGALNDNFGYASGPAGYTLRSVQAIMWVGDQSAVAAGSISPGNFVSTSVATNYFSAYTVALTLPNTPMVMLV